MRAAFVRAANRRRPGRCPTMRQVAGRGARELGCIESDRIRVIAVHVRDDVRLGLDQCAGVGRRRSESRRRQDRRSGRSRRCKWPPCDLQRVDGEIGKAGIAFGGRMARQEAAQRRRAGARPRRPRSASVGRRSSGSPRPSVPSISRLARGSFSQIARVQGQARDQEDRARRPARLRPGRERRMDARSRGRAWPATPLSAVRISRRDAVAGLGVGGLGWQAWLHRQAWRHP